MLTAADVAEIMRLVEQSAFDHLSLEMDGIKLALSRAGAAPASAVTAHDVPAAVATAAVTAPAVAAPDAAASVAKRWKASGGAAAVELLEVPAAVAAPDAAPLAAHWRANGAGPRKTVDAPADPNSREITAPLLGTFYRSPKPGAAPFVEVGSAVAEDTVIAIIEVMKLMNTVRAGIKGVITEILPADEAFVEFGAVLMRARVDA